VAADAGCASGSDDDEDALSPHAATSMAPATATDERRAVGRGIRAP
jgi:hypothetical protein